MIACNKVAQRNQFHYPGSTIHNNEVEEDVTLKIKAGWLKWSNVSRGLDKVRTKPKGKGYSKAIRPTMLYRFETWAVKK